jgi:hypothetical protein
MHFTLLSIGRWLERFTTPISSHAYPALRAEIILFRSKIVEEQLTQIRQRDAKFVLSASGPGVHSPSTTTIAADNQGAFPLHVGRKSICESNADGSCSDPAKLMEGNTNIPPVDMMSGRKELPIDRAQKTSARGGRVRTVRRRAVISCFDRGKVDSSPFSLKVAQELGDMIIAPT